MVQPAMSQSLTIAGEFRPRFEYRDGFRMLLPDSARPAVFVSQRTRLGLTFQQEKLKANMTLQDVRVWGDEPHFADAATLGIHEAWVEVWLRKYLAIKAGRQELNYDDHRLLGNADWAQASRSHDAAVLKLEANKLSGQLGGAYNQLAQNNSGTLYPLNSYKALVFLWSQFRPKRMVNVSLLGIGDAYQEADTISDVVWRYTVGPHLELNPESWLIRLTTFYQAGRTPARTPISAWFASAYAELKWKRAHIGLGADILSGTKPGSGKLQAFHTLYGTNHKFYGLMDHFSVPEDTRFGGLFDAFAKVAVNLSASSRIAVDAHYFSLMEEVADPVDLTFTLSGTLAMEFDVVYSLRITESASFQAGYSIMLPRNSLAHIQGLDEARTGQWAWVMLVAKPSMLLGS